jgi:hypothetical protein
MFIDKPDLLEKFSKAPIPLICPSNFRRRSNW